MTAPGRTRDESPETGQDERTTTPADRGTEPPGTAPALAAGPVQQPVPNSALAASPLGAPAPAAGAGAPPALLMTMGAPAGNRAVAGLVAGPAGPTADAAVAKPAAMTAAPAPVMNAAPPTAAPALPVSTVEPPTGEHLTGLVAATTAARQRLEQLTLDSATRVHEAAALQRDAVARATQDQVVRVQAAYAQAASAVQDSQLTAQQQITADRDAAIQAVSQNTERTTAALATAVADKQRLVLATGQEQAAAAEAVGSAQAARATADSRQQAAAAMQVGQQKAEQWRPQEDGPRIAREAGQLAAEAAKQMVGAGDAAAGQAREDTAGLAGRIRQEAVDASVSLTGGLEQSQQRVQQIQADAVAGIQAAADAALAKLAEQATGLTGQLATQQVDAVAGVQQQGDQSITGITAAETQAATAVQESGAAALTQFDQATADVYQQFAGVAPREASEAAPEAAAQLQAAVDGYAAEAGARIGEVEQSFATAADQAGAALAQTGDQLTAGTAQAATGFDTAARGIADGTATAMSDRSAEAAGGMNDVVTGLAAELQRAVDESTRSWTGMVAQADRDISAKVDKALAGMRDTGTALPGKIDERAREIQDESWWDRAVSFVGGMLGGILESLWDLVKLVALVALVVIAVIVVAVVLGAIIGGLSGVLAVIGVIATIASVVGAILPFALAFGLGFMIVMDLFKIVEAIRRDDLSPAERGRLVGNVVFDVATVVFGEQLAKLAGGLFRGLRGGRAAEEARAMEELAEAEAAAGRKPPTQDVLDALPDQTVMQPARPTSAADAFDMYHNTRAADPAREAAIYRNTETGEYIVVQGEQGTVMVGPGEAPQPGGYAQWWKEILDSGSDVGRWELQAHSHPIDPATGVVSEVNMMPSGANGDMGVVYGESLASGQARSSTIHYTTADGPQQTAFGYAPEHPEPFWVDLPDGAGGRRELRFDSIDAYHDYMANTMKAPQGDVPAWFRPAQPAGEAGAAGESALSRAGERDLVPAAADRPVATVDPADNSVRVRVRGEIEDAIPRADAPGYEKYNEPGSAYGLDDYQRAHMYGPGFGDEVADGIMLAHKDVNLKLQNGAIEKAIRMLGRLAREEGGAVIVDVGVKSHPRVPGQPLLLRSAEYKVSFRRPDGTVVEAFEANIDEIGLPGTRSATNPEVSVTELEFARDNPELIEILQGGD